VGLLVALVFRYVTARGGDSVLAYLSFGVFWVLAAAIVARSIGSLACTREAGVVEHVLILAAFVCLALRALGIGGVAAHLVSLAFFACVIGLVVYYLGQWWMRIGLGGSASR
jgi:hypothetical protein